MSILGALKLARTMSGGGLTLRLQPARKVAGEARHNYWIENSAKQTIGHVEFVQRSRLPGSPSLEVHHVQVYGRSQGQGVSRQAYDLIEKKHGIKMVPSGTLTQDGYRNWLKLLRRHQSPDRSGD